MEGRAMEEWLKALEKDLPHLVNRLAGAVLIVVLGFIALRFLFAPLRRLVDRSRLDPAVGSFLFNTLRTLFLVAVLLAVLQQLGVETTSLLALLGAAGLAIALSLQQSLANFASGLIVLAFRIVRLNDHIEVGDVRGRVCELLPFHVVIESLDNQRITVPNSLLTNGPVRNNSALPRHRLQWALPVSPRHDLARVKEALRARALADDRVLKEPAPQVFVQEWADDKRVVAVQAWVLTEHVLAVQQGLLEELGKALPAPVDAAAEKPTITERPQ
jgi:small conductance mechanosensitive channel